MFFSFPNFIPFNSFNSGFRFGAGFIINGVPVLLFCRACDIVQVVCREGPERVRELMEIGVLFDHSEDGQLHLAREGGHSHHRIVHAADMTGREIERALLAAALRNPNINVFEHHCAVDLLTLQVRSRVHLPGH